ncbi:hypothetical protein G9A89_010658 [Geosiphon pyriformis]|nr:hypothetical protein G9A89_010658 [Geosiphon pyriformis]
MSFTGKTWAQVASSATSCVSSSGSSGTDLHSGLVLPSLMSDLLVMSQLGNCLATLERSLEILANQVSGILKKLSFVELVPLAPLSESVSPVVFVPVVSVLNLDMALDNELTVSASPFSGADESTAVLSSSGSRVLTSKMGGLESKMSALEASVSSVLQADIVHWHVSSGNMVSFITEMKLRASSGPWIKDKTVVVLVGLSGFLNAELNNMHRQANRDCWKFKIKDADCAKWAKFKDLSSSKLLLLSNMFSGAENRGNIDAMWVVLEKILVESADALFSRQWFSKFNYAKNRHSSKFFGLELLVTKIVKKFHSSNLPDVDCLVHKWSTFDNDKACAFVDLLGSRVKSDVILKYLSLVCKDYRRSKMFESKLAKEASIRIVIEKHMENFCSNKSGMIRSVLERPFCKVVLDHLVVNDKLVLEPEEVKSSIDKIIERWMRKHSVHLVLPDLWTCQYAPLDYVQNDAFSGVMCAISIGKLLSVVGGLPNDKAAGLSDIPNELWKYGSKIVLGAWVLMIPKSYDWDGVFTNTRPIALIETARKILSKILSNCILVACSRFDVLQGDNFSVLKSTFTQSPVFAVGSVVENAIKKNREVWLVLQDMWKTYDLASTQYVLNIASEFFVINDISINSKKMVAIPINQGVKVALLSICGQPILIAKKSESHCYLGIFLSTEELSKLKSFEQVQFKGKVAALILFSNASGILGYLFSHKFLDLQVFGWAPLDPLQFSVRLCVNPVNNFLAGVVKIFLSNELSLVNNLPTAFRSSDILGSGEFFAIKDRLHDIWSGFFEVFTDGFLRNAGSVEVASGAAVYFPALNLSVGVAVHGFLSFTINELQAVALSLECVSFSSTVVLYLDSQVAIDACVFELSLTCPDFCNQCWLERYHIFNLIREKDLVVSWVKVKDHSGVSGNEKADLAAQAASESSFSLLTGVHKHFLVAESTAVSSNVCYFVRDIFQSICCAHWEAGSSYDVISDALIGCIDWVVMAKVCHPDSHMVAGFTSRKSLMLHTYFMKAVHRRLLVVVRKRLYNKCYLGVLCLLCGSVEFPNHAFTCVRKSSIRNEILAETSAHWSVLAGVFNVFSSTVL